MITISLPEDVAHDVFDELYNRMEQLDSMDPSPQRERTSAALWAAIQALEAAGSGPAALDMSEAIGESPST